MNAIGVIETNSVPLGILAGDAMLKAADVRILFCQPMCAGKYTVLVGGDVAAVAASTEAGRAVAAPALVDSTVIANLHGQVFPAITATTELPAAGAIGVLETFSIVAAILAADHAVKSADVTLLEIRLGRGLGGKSFVVLSGEVAAVGHAVETVQALEDVQGLLNHCVVIPSPHPDLLPHIM